MINSVFYKLPEEKIHGSQTFFEEPTVTGDIFGYDGECSSASCPCGNFSYHVCAFLDTEFYNH